MNVLTITDNEKNIMRQSSTYYDVCNYITRLFNKRQTINTNYASNTIKGMLKHYDWNIDKEINMMSGENENQYISNIMVCLVFIDLGYTYKKHKTIECIYYFNVSIKKSIIQLIYS